LSPPAIARRAKDRYRAASPAVRAALWFTVAAMLTKGVATLTTPIFTRIMSTDQFGVYSVYRSWLEILGIVTTLRLSGAVFNKGMAKYPEDREGFTVTMQTITTVMVLLFAAVCAIFPAPVRSITGLSGIMIVAMLVELLFAPGVAFWTLRQRYDHRYRAVVLVSLTTSLGVALLGVLAVVLSADKATSRIIAGALVQGTVGIVIYYSNVRSAGRLLDRGYARFALAFNLPLISHYVSMYALDQLDRIMIGQLVGLSAVAVYTVGYTVGSSIGLFGDSMSGALIPWLYQRLQSGEVDRVGHRLTQVFGLYAVIAIAVAAIAPEFVALLGGLEYAGAAYVVPPVVVGAFFMFVYTVCGNMEIYYDANRMMILGSTIAAAANVVLNLLLIPRYGYLAAAYTTLLCYAALAIGHVVYLRRVSIARSERSPFPGRGLLLIAVTLVLVVAVLICMYTHPVIRYALFGVIAIAMVWKRDWVGAVLSGRVR